MPEQAVPQGLEVGLTGATNVVATLHCCAAAGQEGPQDLLPMRVVAHAACP